ncbi:MAG: AraC family transcriptional regulator, partial [Stellaceae bacterium]
MARRIGFLIFPDFQILDLTGPLAAFQTADALGGGDCYRSSVMSRAGGLVSGSAGLEIATVRATKHTLDTFIVPGGRGTRAASISEEHAALVRKIAHRSRRTASVCTGAFLLAAAGLLDGKRATTHWRHAAALQRRHPAVRVEGERIFIKDGAIWSSAGVTAGIDLALALIEED